MPSTYIHGICTVHGCRHCITENVKLFAEYHNLHSDTGLESPCIPSYLRCLPFCISNSVRVHLYFDLLVSLFLIMFCFSIRPPIFSSSLHRYGAERSPGICDKAQESGKIKRNKRAGKFVSFCDYTVSPRI